MKKIKNKPKYNVDKKVRKLIKKYPKELLLLNDVYKIKFKKSIERLGKVRYDSVLGRIDFEKKIIYLNRYSIIDKNNLLFILYHELAHYFCYYYHIDMEETTATAMAKFFLSINKQLNLK